MTLRHNRWKIIAFGAVTALMLTACTQPAQTNEGNDAALSEKLEKLDHEIERVRARGEIENVFNRYQHLHNAFRDTEIIEKLWVKEGTPGVSAQYTNTGIYNTWDSVMEYHRNRPTPTGKLLQHVSTTPVIEVAKDGMTAKGVWSVAGVESGLSDPEVAKGAPEAFFEDELVNGKKVWAHWIQVRYYLDFLKQDGEWRIWHIRVVEVSRAPFSRNWITFASILENNADAAKFHNDILYFGDDGEVVFYPEHDGPPKNIAFGYRTGEAMTLEPELPEPYDSFEDTFEY